MTNYQFQIGYVKKEDALRVLKYHVYMHYVLAFALALVYAILHLSISPKIINLSQEIGKSVSEFYRYTPIVGVLAVLSIIYMGNTNRTEEKIKTRLKKYKTGEMILVGDLIDNSLTYKIMAILIVAILYIVLSTVLPIYELTSSI